MGTELSTCCNLLEALGQLREDLAFPFYKRKLKLREKNITWPRSQDQEGGNRVET